MEVQVHVSDLIEENRSAIGLLEPANPARIGPGERAAFVTEQFAFQKCFGNGGAIDRDERSGGAVAVLIDRPRDELLAGAGIAPDQHRHGRGGDAANLFVDGLHGAALANNGGAHGRGVTHLHRVRHQAAAFDRFGDEIQ